MTKTNVRLCILAMACLIFLANRGFAQSSDTQMKQALKNLTWRSIGPAVMGGRTVDIAGISGDPSTVYMATASGGLFKTTNNGTTWSSIFNDGNTLSLGAVAIAPSDPNIVYIGTGENNPRNSASIGDGIYKSVDAGMTWTHVGLSDTEKTGRIRIHPKNPDIVYVAALGHEWGGNEERGVFRSLNGGRTWEKVLYINEDTGAADLSMDSENPRILYAGMYEFRRLPWNFRSGGTGSGLFRSVDGGDSWVKLTDPKLRNGLPTGVLGRIGVAVAPSAPEIVYAAIEAKEGVMWRSEDRGKTWGMVNDDKSIHSRPFYFSDIRVDPQNETRVYMLEGFLRVSDDGGHTWKTIGNTLHGDHQSLWIDPLDSNRIINGNDGGWGFSYDRGKTWEFINTVALGQFYQITADLQEPYEVCGGLQDNHVWCGPNNNLTPLGILNGDWYRIHPGGDGYYVQVHPSNFNIVYTNAHYGNIQRVDRSTGNSRAIHPYPVNLRGAAASEHPYRFNWNSPIHMSPHDPDIVYFGSNVLFKTTTGGQSWEIVSPDLTHNDLEKIQVSGGPITPDNTSAEYHCTITTIAESPLVQGLIWVGTDDGRVQLTRDGGASWQDLTNNIPGQSPTGWVSRVETSRFSPGTAYVAVDRHRSNDTAPYIFKTTDYGQTWQDLAGNLPTLGYIHVVREDPRNDDVIYVGTELGTYVSFSGGSEWIPLRLNMPPVAVRDIFIHPRQNDLIVGTHGRSIWILDDLSPIQNLANAIDKEVALFETRTATQWHLWNRNHAGYPGQRWLGDQTFYGRNPSYGALINFYLKDPLKGNDPSIKLRIRDAEGTTVRTLVEPATQGVNRVVWDLRYDPLSSRTGVASIGFNSSASPLVLPGHYTIELDTKGIQVSTSLDVRLDPRINITEVEIHTRHLAVKQLTQMENRAMKVLERIDNIREQLKRIIKQLESDQDKKQLLEHLSQFLKPLDKMERQLVRATPNLAYRSAAKILEKIRQLRSGFGNYPGIEGAVAAPTDEQSKWLNLFDKELQNVETSFNQFVSTHVPEINRLLMNSSIPYVISR